MTKATTRRFFFGGTVLFTLIFIGLTIHTHTTIGARTHAENLTEDVVRGLHVWSENNCENCHTLLGEGAYYAPDLTNIVDQKGRNYLEDFLAQPSKYYDAVRDGRVMPDLGLTAQERADVVSFLDWVGDIDTNGWPPRPILTSGVSARGMPGLEGEATAQDAVSRGKAIFDGIGACSSCHARTPGKVLVGPALANLAERSAERLQAEDYGGEAETPTDYVRESVLVPDAHVVGERFVTPGGSSLMPGNYGTTLQPEQVEDLVAYLMTL